MSNETDQIKVFDFNNENYIFKRRLPDGSVIPITAETAKRITLEDSNHIPDLQGNHTQINHYISSFWFHILGPVPFGILFQLYKMCYGKTKNHAWPKVDTIALYTGIDKRTVQRNLPILLEHKLVEVLEVWNKKKKKNESNLYFVRRTTPYISLDLYGKLPEELQKEHDEFMDELVKSNYVQVGNIPVYVRQPKQLEIPIENKGGNLTPLKSVDNQGGNLTPMTECHAEGGNLTPLSAAECHPNNTNSNNTNLNHLIDYNNLNEEFKNLIFKKISKPSYDTWINNIHIVRLENELVYILAPNQFAMEWVQSRYETMILETLKELRISCKAVSVFHE